MHLLSKMQNDRPLVEVTRLVVGMSWFEVTRLVVGMSWFESEFFYQRPAFPSLTTPVFILMADGSSERSSHVKSFILKQHTVRKGILAISI